MNRSIVPLLPAVAAISLLPLLSVNAAAQQGAPAAAPVAVIRKNVRVVLFDAVVTNGDNQPVRNLRAGDFHILDNGAPQRILSFRLIRPTPPPALPPEGFRPPPEAPASLRAPNFITLVFDQLDVSAARLARLGALDFLARDLAPGDYGAVYQVNLRDHLLLPFTAARAQLDEAVRVATTPRVRFQGLATTAGWNSSAGPPVASDPNAITELANSSPAGYLSAEILSMQEESGQVVGDNSMQAAAHATLDSLLDVIHALEAVPGRKAVLYFSDWMPVNQDTAVELESIIAAAQRASITFYTIDPGGLTLTSPSLVSQRRLQAVSAQSATALTAGPDGREIAYTGRGAARKFDSLDEVFDASPGRMRELAKETGGEYLRDRNDLAPALAAAAADLGEHYELSWTPSEGFDGKYHTISVELDRPGLVVHARDGYEAVPDYARAAGGREVDSGQPRIYALLDRDWQRNSPPAPLRLRAAAALMPSAEGDSVELMSQVPFADLRVRSADPNDVLQNHALLNRYLFDLEVLQVVRDPAGNIIRAFLRPFRVSMPPHLVAPVQRGFLTIENSVSLPPGRYRVQTAIYQPRADLGGVASAELTVPEPAPKKLRLGDIVLVSTSNPSDAAHPVGGQLVYGGQQLRPNLTGRMSAPADPETVGFYFVAALPPHSPRASMSASFSREGSLVSPPPLELTLPPPDAGGRIAFFALFPAAALSPGRYRARIRVQAGRLAAERTLRYTVAFSGAPAAH